MDGQTTIPIQAPNGVVHLIPPAQKDEALRAGGRLVTKMLDPQGTARWIPQDQEAEALKAGGKLAPAAAVQAPASLQEWANPHNEGTYKLQKGGKSAEIPYSDVGKAIQQGYSFADEVDKSRFAKDYASGPKWGFEEHRAISNALGAPVPDTWGNRALFAAHATGQDIMRDISGTPVAGAEKEARKTLGGAVDLVAKEERAGISPTDVERYQHEHPGTTKEQAKDALSHQANLQRLSSDIEKDTELHGIGEDIGALGEQIGEIMLPEGLLSDLAEGAKVAEGATDAEKASRVGKFLDEHKKVKALTLLGLKSLKEGAKAAGEQGAQQLVKSGGNLQQIRQAAEGGAVFGTAAPAVMDTGGWLLGQAAEGGKFFSKTSDIHVGKLVRDTMKKNEAIDKDIADTIDANERGLKAYEEAKTKAHDDYQKALEAAHTEAEKAKVEATLGAASKMKEAEANAEKARVDAENAIARQKGVNEKRAQMENAAKQTRATIQKRIQNIYNAARVYFKGAYGDLEREAGSKGVDYGTLADGVHEALQKVKGSAESTKTFKDILARAGRLEGGPEPSREVLERLAELDPDERAIELKRMREEGEPVDASLADLNGYYSELGRVIHSPSVPGDVQAAASYLRDYIDREIKSELGDELYEKNKAIRAKYRRFAEGFKNYSGPVSSGSPVAQSLEAAEAHHATKPLLAKQHEVQERIKDILVGTPGKDLDDFLGKGVADDYKLDAQGRPTADGDLHPGWRYRKKTHSLIEHLRNLNEGISRLTSDTKMQKDVDAANRTLEAARSAERDAQFAFQEAKRTPEGSYFKEPKPMKEPKEFEPKPLPEHEKISPERMAKIKKDWLEDRANIVNNFGTYVLFSGLVGSLFALTGLGSKRPGEAIKKAEEGIAVGAFGPYVMARILEKPGVIDALSKVSPKDFARLMKLPEADRPGIEDMIVKLSKKAVKEGKLKQPSPWIRIIAGEAGRRAAVGKKQQQQEQGTTDQQIDQISRELATP